MRPTTVNSLTLATLGLCAVFLFQNCSQFEANHQHAAHSPSTQGPNYTGPKAFAVPLPLSGAASSIHTGEFNTLAAGTALNFKISGRASLIRTADGKTRVDVIAHGLPPSSPMMAHVHALSCALGGGGHYKIDPSVSAALESNEIWPQMFSDATGYGWGTVTVNHVAGADAVSVVIHGGPNAAKVACADLLPAQPTPAVEAATLVVGGTSPGAVTGRAVMVRKASGQTEVRSAVLGLTAATAYPSHVHDLACADLAGHYKIDPAVTAAVETNEIWPLFTTNAAGQGFGHKVVPHIVRPGMHSIVVHDPVSGARLACGDFNAGGGGFLPTEAGLTRNRIVIGEASMQRQVAGNTVFGINVSGLAPNTSYVAHVHARPCALGVGGGHYKIDDSVTAAIEANEIWLNLAADAGGAANVSVTAPHIVRPDAVSIVIHDSTDGAKLSCADLY